MPSYPKIDMHQHAQKMMFETDGSPAMNFVTGKPSIADSDESLIIKTLEEMDKYNIEKSILSGSLEDLERWMNIAPDRFIPSIEISGNPPQVDVETIREEYESGRIKCIGEITTQYAGLAPNDRLLDPYWALAEELDAPVFIHTHGTAGFIPTFRSSNGNPLLLEDVLAKHPKLRLWVENAGYPFRAEMIALMMMHPNVYADLSTHAWVLKREGFYDHLEGLINGGFTILRGKSRIVYGEPIAKRLMFGSDQMAWPETIGMVVDTIDSAPFLSKEQKRDIFYNNAKRFLRL